MIGCLSCFTISKMSIFRSCCDDRELAGLLPLGESTLLCLDLRLSDAPRIATNPDFWLNFDEWRACAPGMPATPPVAAEFIEHYYTFIIGDGTELWVAEFTPDTLTPPTPATAIEDNWISQFAAAFRILLFFRILFRCYGGNCCLSISILG